MDLSKTQVKEEFISSLTLKMDSIMNKKYTIKSDLKHLDGKIFYSETVTPRTSPRSHGLGKTQFFIKGVEAIYSTPLELVNSIKQ